MVDQKIAVCEKLGGFVEEDDCVFLDLHIQQATLNCEEPPLLGKLTDLHKSPLCMVPLDNLNDISKEKEKYLIEQKEKNYFKIFRLSLVYDEGRGRIPPDVSWKQRWVKKEKPPKKKKKNKKTGKKKKRKKRMKLDVYPETESAAYSEKPIFGKAVYRKKY